MVKTRILFYAQNLFLYKALHNSLPMPPPAPAPLSARILALLASHALSSPGILSPARCPGCPLPGTLFLQMSPGSPLTFKSLLWRSWPIVTTFPPHPTFHIFLTCFSPFLLLQSLPRFTVCLPVRKRPWSFLYWDVLEPRVVPGIGQELSSICRVKMMDALEHRSHRPPCSHLHHSSGTYHVPACILCSLVSSQLDWVFLCSSGALYKIGTK